MGGPVLSWVLLAAAAFQIIGGVVFAALAVPDELPDAGTRRLELLGNAASSITAVLILGAVLLGREVRRVLAVAAGIALVLVLLALNGVIVDLTGDSPRLGIGRAVARFAVIALAGYVLLAWYRSSPQRTSSTT